MTRFEFTHALVTDTHVDPIQVIDLGEGEPITIEGYANFTITITRFQTHNMEIIVPCKAHEMPKLGARVSVVLEVQD